MKDNDGILKRVVMSRVGPAFANSYLVKLVAECDSKACFICYKPASTVLLSENSVDFFYICPSHLKDEQFAVSIKPDEYTELLTQKISLESKLEKTQKHADEIKPYKLTSFVNGYLKSDKKEKEDEGKNKDKYKELVEEIQRLKAELAKVTDSITSYKFKNYQLNKSIYNTRVQNYNKVMFNRMRSQKIQSDPGLFPSVPTNKIESKKHQP